MREAFAVTCTVVAIVLAVLLIVLVIANGASCTAIRTVIVCR